MKLSVLLLSTLLCTQLPAQEVTFNYAPPRSLTVICLPDDWQKTLATGNGALAYDFGPGPYAVPLTEVGVSLAGQTVVVDTQTLADPRVPIVTTLLHGEHGRVHLETWSLARPFHQASQQLTDRVSRSGGLNGCLGWANPPAGADAAFRDAAWGTNRPIRYRVSISPGNRATVALGVCEPYKPAPGARFLELRVEGAPVRTVDPLADGPKNSPLVYLFDAHDANSDGSLAIEVFPSAQGPDPNVFLNAFWVFPPDIHPDPSEVARGKLNDRAEVYYDCGEDLERAASGLRFDAIIATAEGGDPIITLKTGRGVTFDSTRGIVLAEGVPFIMSRPAIVGAEQREHDWVFHLPPGTQKVGLVTMHGHEGRDGAAMPDLDTEPERARTFWRNQSVYPPVAITVPNAGIQYLLETSMRTLYQVREYVDGHAQFQPGPTVYRGMWAASMFLTGIPIMVAGDTSMTRRYIESVMLHQNAGGQVRAIYPNVLMMETPMMVAAACYYARATGNREWLAEHWTSVVNGIRWIEQMRGTVKPEALYAGLMPPGFVDGGLSEPTADYGSAWWALIALDEGARAAASLGKNDLAARWRDSADGLRDAFARNVRRDVHPDDAGIRFLPVAVGDTSTVLPQRGQWALMVPVPYSRFSFDKTMQDVVRGNLAMLDARREEGLVVSSGWVTDAVWVWLSGVYAMAHLQVGDPARAQEVLYAYANHATTTGTWIEEQQVRSKGTRTGGDVSDAEQSGVFLALVRSMIALERDESLEFLASIPPGWVRPGATIALRNSFTRFGPVTMTLTISGDGRRGEIRCDAVDGRGSAGTPAIRLSVLKAAGYSSPDGSPLPDVVNGTWKKAMKVEFWKAGG